MDRRPGYRTPALLALVLAFGVLGSCGPSSPKHYALRGHVLSKDNDLVTVSHEDIPGLMSAMTMPYRVKNPAEFEKVEPGDSITADLVVDANKNNWLEQVVITDRSGRDSLPSITADELEPGAEIPDVKLINQDGKTIHLSEFKGRAVLLTFIYTRCPFADFCPLLSHEFAALDRELIKTPGDYKRTHLMSISLDPAWDKPPVLRKYGLIYLQGDPAGFAHWDFVATAPEDLKKLAAAFNLTYFEKDNQITHNLRTVLLGTDGTVQKVWSGNEWRKQEIVDAVRQAASEPASVAGGPKP
jgi:protein SCO1/2